MAQIRPSGTTVDEALAEEMSKVAISRQPFLDVAEHHYLIRDTTKPIHEGTQSTAVGTTGIGYCIGLYFELDDHRCLMWHIFGQVMYDARSRNIPLAPGSANFKHISATFRNWLDNKVGKANEKMAKTLVLATGLFTEQNWAIIDGILEWIGLDDTGKATWVQTRLRCASAFIVETPSDGKNEAVVKYWPPTDVMLMSHPVHWTRTWDRLEDEGEWDWIKTLKPINGSEVAPESK